jgi:molybdate transport system regulatory protein
MLNNLSENPLVDRVIGEKGRGSTILTKEGKNVIEQFRVVQLENRRFLENLEGHLGDYNLYQFLRRLSMKVSARNVFSGTIEKITRGAVNAEVILLISEGTRITSIITNGAIENLSLKEGMHAYAIIKASSIIIGTDLERSKISARNIISGKISKIIEGPVSSEIDVEVGGSNVISATITHGSSEKLALKKGELVSAIFKASSVIIGIS